MLDKRKDNGGHSTKATKATDKRLNPHKALLDKYITEDFNYDKLKELMEILYKAGVKGDTKSSSLFLAYILGKPIETKVISGKLEHNLPEWLDE